MYLTVLKSFICRHFFPLMLNSSVVCFQATGMELNLSKNVISCGDPGMTCSLLALTIKLLPGEVDSFIV